MNIKIGDVAVGMVPCMSAALAKDAQKVAQNAYVQLFLLENSARELINRIMTASHGTNWWSSVATHIQKKAADYSVAEAKNGWHPSRGSDPVQFVDLPDLSAIVTANWTDFQPIFTKPEWFANFITDLNVTRRAVAHMNALAPAAFKYVDVSFEKWSTLLQSKAAIIP